MKRFFSEKESDFFVDVNKRRKLILTSQTVNVNLDKSKDESIIENKHKIETSVKNIINYLNDINTNLVKNNDMIISDNFMDFHFHAEDVHIVLKHFDDNKFDKKFKYLLNIISASHPPNTSGSNSDSKTIICCSKESINILEEQLKRRKFKFSLIAEGKL